MEIEVSPSEFTESTPLVSVTVRIPINGNTWIAPFFYKQGDVSSTVTLITERPAAVQLSGLESETGGVLGISALGLGL